MCADSPDTSGMNAAAEQSSKLGAEQFAWFKQYVADTQPQRDAAAATAAQVSQSQVKGMDYATSEAQRLSERNQTVFQPLEDKIVADAQAYDTPERRAEASGQAVAGVEGAFGRAQEANTRALMRMGGSTTSGATQALMQDAALAKATASAGASSAAVRGVEQQGYARTQDAAALGKGLIGNQATQQQIATATGGSAVNSGNSALSAATSAGGLMQTGFSGAMQGTQQSGQLYGQAANMQAQSGGDLIGGITGLASAAGSLGWMPFSDKGMKKGTGKKADGKKALARIVSTPVEEGWQYDEEKGAPAGLGGVDHIGPMAQSVRAKMGDAAAPGGKRLDLVNINGQLMAGMQELARKVAKLETRAA